MHIKNLCVNIYIINEIAERHIQIYHLMYIFFFYMLMTIYISQVLAVYVNIRAAHSSTRSLMGSNVTSKLRWQLRYCGVGSTGSQYGYVSTWSRPLNEPSLITTISAAKYVLWPWKIEKMM